jgi:hypothetical protein
MTLTEAKRGDKKTGGDEFITEGNGGMRGAQDNTRNNGKKVICENE